MAYRDLSLRERHAVIRECVANGIHRLSDIEAAYNAAQQPANEFAEGGSIHIAPSKRGTFAAAATKHGKSVQAFASQVLSHKENYSPAMVKKANFARNFGGHRHGDGGDNLTSSPDAELFLDDYAYRAALENPSITPDIVTSAVSNLNFETQNKEGIGGTYDYSSKTVYLPNINKWSQQAGHEIGGHHLRNELFGNMSAVSSDRAQMLEEALPNFYVPLEEIQKSRPLQERIATNTELRAAIIQNTGLSGEALDDYINNMSDVDLLSLLYRNGNGYITGSKVPFIRKGVVLSNGQKANIDDYTDLQSVPEGHTSEDWLGISEEERQQLIKEYQTLFDSNLTEEDRKQAEALRWTLLNIAQNNTDFHKSDNTYLAAFGGSLSRNAAHWHSGTAPGESSYLNNDATYVSTQIPIEPIEITYLDPEDNSLKVYNDLSEKGKAVAHTTMLYEEDNPLEIVSPEFDLLTLGRSIFTSPLLGTPIKVNPGEYFRVVGKDAVVDAQKSGIVRPPVVGRLDMKDIPRVSKLSGISESKLVKMTSEEQKAVLQAIRENPKISNTDKLIRFKSNHGDVGFEKEGFFYYPKRTANTAVIKGTEHKSTFLGGHHGSYTGLINNQIYPESPVVLRGGNSVYNFTKWTPALLGGWRETPLVESSLLTGIKDAIHVLPPTVGGLIYQDKYSTGGPLYPFSFSKKPLPPVRH